jgi:protein-S-isoprenylcysteine O-methyltransferase Ste14
MFTYLAVGLLFVLLVVFAVMARKHWHWSNIVAVILTFVAGTASMFGAARVYQLRHAVMKDANDSEVRAERAEEE